MRLLSQALAIASFLAATSAAGAESAAERYGEEYQTCRNGNTHDIDVCVDKLVKAWQGRVDSAYKKLIGMTVETDRRVALRKSQALWTRYRDANCTWYDTGEGTIRRIEAGECMRSMTAARAIELEAEGETH